MVANEFQQKIAVVTGAGRGIGQTVADALRNSGAKVAALDIEFSHAGDHQFLIDVTDSKAVDQTISAVEERLGEIDYLVNVAGILRVGSLLECNDEDWQRTFAVNTTGAFNVCRAVGRRMLPRRRGAIVAVSSNAASVPRIGMGAYAASKAATSHMLKCLGLELAHANIRCNIVAPGSTDTAMQQQLWTEAQGAKNVIAGSAENYRLGIPLQRIASAENIAAVVLFLLSSNAAHITLESILVDGGATLGC
ncbi:MAG: 2,3-dihydro-2,3-dihydroxybenzoate dehydrogenase [Cellvibrionaceae bacterium]|nr:2,3-dihydro-2,3-dihydroxybenzoate dehydrogenase [Cellvibrionaceae bacterium]